MADYTFYVKVANSKFVLDSVSQATIALGHGITYRFDQSDSSNSNHPLAFSTTSDGTHNSGSAYTTGVTTTGTAGSSGAYVDIAVTSSTPASLYYYCSNHSGMGSAVITTGNTHVTTNNLGLLLPILANADDQWGSHINQSLRKIEDTFGANADVYTYNITGDTTAITGSATAGGTLAFSAGQHLEVYLNGVKLVGNLSSGNDYTVNASTNTITLASNAINGDVVNIVVFKTFQFADAVPATGGTFSGNVAYTGNIQVDDIVEKTSAHGVEIDGVTLKDGGGTFTGNVVIPDGGNIGSASDTDAVTIASTGKINTSSSNAGTAFEIENTNGTTNYGLFIKAGSSGSDAHYAISANNYANSNIFRVAGNGNLKFDSGFGSAQTAYGCRAWVFYDQINGNVLGSGNVTSVADNATGDFTISFSNAMPDSNYCAIGGSIKTSGDTGPRLATLVSGASKSINGVQIIVEQSDGTNEDESNNSIAIFR